MALTVAVTRPEPQASGTAARLAALGHRPILAPLLRAVETGPLGSAEGIGALAITSRTAARRLAASPTHLALPIFAVGKASAAEARAAGASNVAIADGAVEDLLRLILQAASEPIVHLAGRDHRGDLVERLEAKGRRAERRIIYAMEPAERLPAPRIALDAVLIYSPRTAQTFERLATLPVWRRAVCVALSEAVARPLAGRTVAVAERPDEAALFATLERLSPVAAPFDERAG